MMYMAAIVIIVAGMKAAADLLVLILLAAFIAILGSSPVEWLRTQLRLPTGVALAVVMSALLLGGALLMTVAAHKAQSPGYEAAALVTATILLSLAAITKYLLPAFIPAFLIYVILRHGVMRSLLFALAPLTIFMTLFFWLALAMNWADVALPTSPGR